MNCTVNLVPRAPLLARRRVYRRNVWLWTCGFALGLLALGVTTHAGARSALTRLNNEVATLEQQSVEVQRRLVAAGAQRAALLEQLNIAASARRPQPWPERFVELTRAAPEGVYLTRLDITSSDEPARAAPKAAAPAAKPGGATAVPAVASGQTVKLLGYALDHAALLQFVNALQRLPGWTQVELVRATQDAVGAGAAIAFQLDARTLSEAAP